MKSAQRLYFPEARSKRAAAGRWIVGLIIVGVGVAAVVASYLGIPLEWSDGDVLPVWVSLLIGAVFAGAGVVILCRREYAEVDLQRGCVVAWRDLGDTFRTRFRLALFDAVRVVPWLDEGDETVGYTLWLTGDNTQALLETFEDRERAVRRAEEAAAKLGLTSEVPPQRR